MTVLRIETGAFGAMPTAIKASVCHHVKKHRDASTAMLATRKAIEVTRKPKFPGSNLLLRNTCA